MLHILRSGAGAVPDKVMQSMFAARKAVFVDLLRWDIPVINGAFEVDQFDDEHADYLVLTDRDGNHLGSARLLPTMRPHILGNLYPELCEQGPPRAPEIFEITRFCLDRSLRASERRFVRDTLITALVDHALGSGVGGYTAIAEMGWLQQILGFGWRCRPLGLPIAICGKLLGALRIEIDATTPHLLAQAGIVVLPTLLDHDTRVAA